MSVSEQDTVAQELSREHGARALRDGCIYMVVLGMHNDKKQDDDVCEISVASGLLVRVGSPAGGSRAPVRRRRLLVVLAEIEVVGLPELTLSSFLAGLFQLGAVLLFSFRPGSLRGLGPRRSGLVFLPIALLLLRCVSLATSLAWQIALRTSARYYRGVTRLTWNRRVASSFLIRIAAIFASMSAAEALGCKGQLSSRQPTWIAQTRQGPAERAFRVRPRTTSARKESWSVLR